jgi:hypothetical protein
MKKLLSVTMSIVIMLSCMIFTVPAQAATQIKENQTVEVVFQRNTSLKQTFTYTMPAGGYFYYKVVPKYSIFYDIDGVPHYDTGLYLPETKLTYNYKEYGKSSVFYGSNWRSPSYCFKKGAVVTISLEDHNDSSTESYYDLTVYFKKVKNFESENNNSKKTADKISLKKTYTGLMMDGDTDYWVFTAPKTGKYKFSVAEINEGYHNTFYAYKGSKKVKSLYIGGGDGYKTLYKAKLKKGKKIYVKLTDGSNGEMYKIKVKKV